MEKRNVSHAAMVIAAGMIIAFAVATAPTKVVLGNDLYAAGVGSGKTKPLVDIENKLAPPSKDKPVAETKEPLHKQILPDSARTVEDASKYQLTIDPIYPRKARMALKQGTVEVELTFDKNGKMKDARIKNCTTPGWGFEQAVLAASLDSRLKGNFDREITVKATLKFQLE